MGLNKQDERKSNQASDQIWGEFDCVLWAQRGSSRRLRCYRALV
jgi:hypothetical protein